MKLKVILYAILVLAFIGLQNYIAIVTNPFMAWPPLGQLIPMALVLFVGVYILLYQINQFIEEAVETKKKLYKLEKENLILRERLRDLEEGSSKDRSVKYDR
jgi:uncharacterized membrane protein